MCFSNNINAPAFQSIKKRKEFVMPDMFNMTPEMSSYFNSLPKNIQSSFVYSGAKVNSLVDLKQLVNKMEGKDGSQFK